MPGRKIPVEQIHTFLDEFNCWSVQDNKLHRQYMFENFTQAFGFMTEVALWAERMDHHPEWFNSYKTVVVDLITHEAGGITELDILLAKKIEEIAARGSGDQE